MYGKYLVKSTKKVLENDQVVERPFTYIISEVTDIEMLKSMIDNDILLVIKISEDSNSYGEGIFIQTVINTDKPGIQVFHQEWNDPERVNVNDRCIKDFTFYALSYHYIKEVYQLISKFDCYSSSLYNTTIKDISVLSDCEVFTKLNQFVCESKEDYETHKETITDQQQQRNNIYDHFSDILPDGCEYHMEAMEFIDKCWDAGESDVNDE